MHKGHVLGVTGFVKVKELKPREHGSECVDSLEYDLEHQQMTVHFNKRGSYVYFDVPPEEYAAFNTAGSRGTYFNLYIRDKYSDYERL
jgi:lysyl-tRNA synthetase class 2